MPTMGKRTMNIHVTKPINCRREHQVQDVTRTKKRGFSNPLTRTITINRDKWLLPSFEFEGGRYTIITKTSNLTILIQTTFWQSNIKNSNSISPTQYPTQYHIYAKCGIYIYTNFMFSNLTRGIFTYN